MSARLPKTLRRREAERRRVETFVAVIRAMREAEPRTAPQPIPLPRVEPVDTPRGRVWRLDDATRARLRPATGAPQTAELPMSLVRLIVQP